MIVFFWFLEHDFGYSEFASTINPRGTLERF